VVFLIAVPCPKVAWNWEFITTINNLILQLIKY
jgi:hypothetical protein